MNNEKHETVADIEAAAERKSCPVDAKILSLDEAIAHAEECVDATPCGQNHRQLAAWLNELRELKQKPAGKMRTALKEAEVYFDAYGTPTSHEMWLLKEIQTALAAPPRNCEAFNNYEELEEAYNKAVRTEGFSFGKWLFSLAKKGVAK